MKKYIALLILIISCQSETKDLGQKIEEAFKNKKWVTAISYLNEAIEKNPNDAYSYYTRALAETNLKKKKDINQIISDLDNSLRIDTNNNHALFLRFQANLVVKKFKDSERDINILIKKNGESPMLLAWKANCSFLLKDFKTAEEAYEKRLNMSGQYEEMRFIYYYWMFSKYFGGNKEGALWDCAFLTERGFEENVELINIMEADKLNWKELANFEIPSMTIEQFEEQIKKKN